MEVEEEVLKDMEDCSNYPPRFQVVITCSPAAQQSQARIKFKGAHKELVFDIPLQPGINPEQGHINNTHGLIKNMKMRLITNRMQGVFMQLLTFGTLQKCLGCYKPSQFHFCFLNTWH